jgi:tetratricopeptide (TPR) repeat protein
MLRLLRVALTICAISGLAAAPLSAKEEPATAAATVLFDEAVALMDQQRYAEACPKLARSQELAPSGGTLLNLAKCYEKNRQIASAWLSYEQAAQRAALAQKPELEKLARAAADKLAPSVSTLLLTLKERADGLQIRRDGEIITSAQLGVALPIDPGEHVIEASAPGRVPWRTVVRVYESKQALAVEIPRLELAPAESAASGAGAYGADLLPSPSDQKTIGVGLAAAGVLGLGLGTYFGLRAISKNDDAAQYCRTETLCDQRGLELDQEAHTAASVSTVAFVAGGALLTAGAVLFFTAPGDARSSVGVVREPNGGRLLLRRRF